MEDKIIDRLLVITGGAMLMNGKQVAQALGLHPTTISELKSNGSLGVPVNAGTGKRDRYSVVAVARYLLGLSQPKPVEEPSTPLKPPRKSKPQGGLPTLEQVRAMALRHFIYTLQTEAQKAAETALLLQNMVEREDLYKKVQPSKPTPPEAL